MYFDAEEGSHLRSGRSMLRRVGAPSARGQGRDGRKTAIAAPESDASGDTWLNIKYSCVRVLTQVRVQSFHCGEGLIHTSAIFYRVRE